MPLLDGYSNDELPTPEPLPDVCDQRRGERAAQRAICHVRRHAVQRPVVSSKPPGLGAGRCAVARDRAGCAGLAPVRRRCGGERGVLHRAVRGTA